MLGAIPYSTNRAQLHTDESVLPRHRRARASWNYLVTPGEDHVVVTYDVSRLMRLDGNRRYLVTLGGADRVDPASVIAEMTYSHPVVHTGIRCGPSIVADARRRSGGVRGRLPRLGLPRGRRRLGPGRGPPARRRLADGDPARGGVDAQPVLTPRSTAPRSRHSRQAPVRHSFEYRSYSWYVDVDDLPRLPWWLRPFARFRASDHFSDTRAATQGSLRDRLSAFFADRNLPPPEGRITALLQPRVFGYVFNPLSVFWCHDRDGTLRHVIAEVHNTYGERHAYLLPPADLPVITAKKLYVSPFNAVDGYYLVQAPRPDSEVDITVALHRDRAPAFAANLRGQRRPATDPAGRDHANHFAAGTAGGGRAHPNTGDQTVVTSSSGGTAMTVIETIGKPSAAIDSKRWPAIAKVPSGPVRAAVGGRRRPAAAPRGRAPAAATGLPRRHGGRCGRPDRADPGRPPTGSAGAPDRAATG